jgi:8-oxo-dGTP pyrophosphatase MutT (NUDIX family)
VLISCDRSQINKNFARILDNPKDIQYFLSDPSVLFDGHSKGEILVICDKPGENMCHFLDHLDIVVAGGGIVTNENDEILLMFRRGKWDLPKGKIELNECIKDGAIREVEEETGVQVDWVSEKPVITYHAYKLKGKNCMKETNWFNMKAKPGQNRLVPQTEEDIEDVRWVKKQDLHKYKDGSYLLIWDLLAPYATPPSNSANADGK